MIWRNCIEDLFIVKICRFWLTIHVQVILSYGIFLVVLSFPAFAHTFSGIWPPNFFWDLNQKSAPILSANCTFTHILKISGKNIEKCRRWSNLSEAHFGNITNWDLGDFVHFWLFFWPIIHILAVIGREIELVLYFKPTYHIKLVSLKNIDIWQS